MIKKTEIEAKLIAVKSNKSIDFSNQITTQKITSEFGKPITIEKENLSDLYGAEPWTILKYNGLEIVLEGDFISEITVSNEDWKIGDFKVGDKESKILTKLERAEKKDSDYNLYLFPKLDGVFFCKTNKQDEVIKLGISNTNF
ncbi:hypothetical protein GCM10010992_05770 [Cloacibacterium rupense]|uniref:Uncharacterized protein n=1 Tax=Cloacibacterium rupense TaxID=517423 RepID=A0ABQ2NGY3_9FLAO|nr:hypothetical protein GCM10010992_05770 [Cloacibacterium rupense]